MEDHIVGSPPIAQLDRDVLWRIFAINAVARVEELPEGVYTYDDLSRWSALTTTRYTSQVCVSWRQLIIGSSSLWGNVIDLQFLNQKSDTWRNEVLLRTGNSELSIIGSILRVDDRGSAGFFQLLLKNHWTRIVSVNVTIHSFDTRKWPDDAWSALERPAPNLRSFSITFDDEPHRFSSPGFSLFANHAPLLTRFSQNRAPINHKASWLAGLTSLELNSVPTLSILLDMCSHLHSLRALQLFFPFTGPELGNQLRSVNIPSLTTLFIRGAFDIALEFLDNITTAPGCSLRLSGDPANTVIQLSPAQRIIGRFANSYFSHHSSTSIYLKFTPYTIGLEDFSDEFEVSIRFQSNIPTTALTLCSAKLLPAYFSQVKMLRLYIEGLLTADPLKSLFREFLITMTALEKLRITTDGLNLFITSFSRDTQERVFLHLKTIILDPYHRDMHSRELPDSTTLIKDFLDMRRKMGFPIEILDLTKWNTLSKVPMDIKKLEEFSGLKVVWRESSDVGTKRRKYVCGSGRLQELGLK